MIAAGEVARLLPMMHASARELARALPAGQTIDLVESFAAPWCHGVALAYAKCPRDEASHLLDLARRVFLRAAHATDRASALAPSPEVSELARALAPSDSPLAVQAFVALAHTLPLLLAGAWEVLATEPEAWRELRETPALRPSATEELLRLASPARVVFRHAPDSDPSGATRFAAGGEVVLELQRANRCPAHFAEPERFAAGRFAAASVHPRHVGLGLPPHACAGGGLVRTALDVATSTLLDTFADVELAGPVRYLDGFAIRGPISLPVVLRRADECRRREGRMQRVTTRGWTRASRVAVGALLAVHALLAWTMRVPGLATGHDDAWYIALGRALAARLVRRAADRWAPDARHVSAALPGAPRRARSDRSRARLDRRARQHDAVGGDARARGRRRRTAVPVARRRPHARLRGEPDAAVRRIGGAQRADPRGDSRSRHLRSPPPIDAMRAPWRSSA